MKVILPTLALALLLTGCASKVWMKDGATAADFNRDKSACMSHVSAAGDPILAAMFLPDCLRGRGYTLEEPAKFNTMNRGH